MAYCLESVLMNDIKEVHEGWSEDALMWTGCSDGFQGESAQLKPYVLSASLCPNHCRL